jgi:hypothetical protein
MKLSVRVNLTVDRYNAAGELVPNKDGHVCESDEHWVVINDCGMGDEALIVGKALGSWVRARLADRLSDLLLEFSRPAKKVADDDHEEHVQLSKQYWRQQQHAMRPILTPEQIREAAELESEGKDEPVAPIDPEGAL